MTSAMMTAPPFAGKMVLNLTVITLLLLLIRLELEGGPLGLRHLALSFQFPRV